MKQRIKILYWLSLISYAVLIFYLSSREDVPIPQVFFNQDKLLHLIEYGIFSILAILAFQSTFIEFSLKKIFITAFCITLLYGASDEIHQYFVPGRYASFIDIIFDGVGAICGIVTFKYTRIRRIYD